MKYYTVICFLVPGKFLVLELLPKVLLSNQITEIFQVHYLKEESDCMGFMHVRSYLWKPQIDHVI